MKYSSIKQLFKTSSYQAFVLIIFLAVIELLSFTLITSKRGIKETLAYHPAISAVYSYLENLNLNIDNVTSLGHFSPTVQDRYQPNTYYGPLRINECGYISNTSQDEDDCRADLFSENAFKIFLVGGSSIAGSGIKACGYISNTSQDEDDCLTDMFNEKTIASMLQSKLLEKYPNIKFLVFNFGAGGSYSFRQSQLVLSELVTYKPNIILSFDGFNDAFYWHLEPLRGNKKLYLKKPIPNWADYSYANYLKNIGYSKPSKGSFFLTYTIDLARIIGNRLKPQSPWDYSPEYLLSREIKNDPQQAASYFYRNIASMAFMTVNSGKNVCFIEILQADSHHNSTRSKQDEINLIKWHTKYESRYGKGYNYENYKKNMLPIYAAYAKILKEDPFELKKSFGSNYRWYDYRNIFRSESSNKSFYVDNIHTNIRGNDILSTSFLSLVDQSSCFKSYQNDS
tara:strand:+ start:744 stop:2105 length:1362 start_codon:yes stop_codon:yes gene_type:complete